MPLYCILMISFLTAFMLTVLSSCGFMANPEVIVLEEELAEDFLHYELDQ